MNSKDLYLRLLRYVSPHRRIFIVAMLATVVLAATEPALPALMKPLLDGSFVAKDPNYIIWMPVLIALVFLIRGAATFASAVALKWVATRVVMDIRNAMFDKLLMLPDPRFADIPTGNMLSKFSYNVERVMSASTKVLVILVRDVLALLGLLIWVFYLNWKLSLIILMVAPSIAVVVRIVSRRLRRLSRHLQTIMGDFNHVIDEVIQGHRVMKVFGGQQYERRRLRQVNNRLRQFHMKLTVAADSSVPGVQFLAVIALGVVFYIASQQAASGALSVGGFVSLFGAMALMLAPIKRLTNINEELQKGLAAAESVFELIDEPPEQDLGQQEIGRAQGRVRFEGVGFRYPSGKPVLKHLDLEVSPGETVALVGISGSGKTSLVNLLPRFYDPSEGRILLDGIDIKTLKLASLRAQFAYVGQNVVLFNDSVAANIAYGVRDADPGAVRAAAQDADALGFIEALPRGFATLIGENGVRLSGGQRQRLAIARALLKNAPVLILDEATSALDSHAERQVQQALERLRRARTVFVVAHRLSTIENADRIVVLSEGEIVESGRHRELLALGGVYAELYRMQDRTSARATSADALIS